MQEFRLQGLCAAAVTPMREDGSLRLEQIGPIVNHLISEGVSGFYVCGSTGEGVSLTQKERQAVAEAYVKAVNGRLPVIIQVGQNSLSVARELAEHAQAIGADATSSMAPSYFKASELQILVDSMSYVASSAPNLPFYYYHIPAMTGVDFNMVSFLKQAAPSIPNLNGVKFSTPALHLYQQCLEYNDGQYDIQWGVDEMLLGALATGATGAVGSTYGIAAPVFLRIIEAHANGDLETARQWQSRASEFISIMASFPFHSSLREVLKLQGFDCGYCRLPQRRLTSSEAAVLKDKLDAIGFFAWCNSDAHEKKLRSETSSNGDSSQLTGSARRHERI